MIVLDASVLIAHLNAHDPCHSRARQLLLDSAEHKMAASSITLAEVLVAPVKAGRADKADAALQALEIAEIPIKAGTAARLAKLRATTGLKLPDCCVLLAAEDVRATAVLSFDDRLTKRAEELGYEWPQSAK